MIKAALFSDTHSNTVLMLEAIRRERPDVVIHLGDHDRDALSIRESFPELPLYSVCGNCDLSPLSPETDVVPLGSVKAFIAHGHQYNVRYSRDSLVYAALERGCSLALYGHTHSPENSQLGSVMVVNPGTAGQGRELTNALITVFDNSGIAVEIKDL